MAVEIEENLYDSCLTSMKKIKSSLEQSIQSLSKVVGSISNDWKGDGSSNLTDNIKKNISNFQTYVDSMDYILKDLEKNFLEYKNVQKKTSQSTETLLSGKGGV